MKRAKIVIGANYGDEGKGLMTDYFCREAAAQGETCLNVLTNGGPQRGHTVVTPEGIRHIFHHLGSGSFAGADTFFCDAFLINPMIFRGEYEALRRAGADFRVFVHPACRWTTPYDMILNQMAEEFRGGKRHGSCGFGIWETVLRCRKGAGSRTFGECDEAAVREVLIFMRDEYVPARALELGMPGIPEVWREILAGVLPYVDFFVPSFEELCYMLDRPRYDELSARGGDITEQEGILDLADGLARTCLEMGCGAALIKCGLSGMAWRTGSRERFARVGERLKVNADAWADRAGRQPCFPAETVRSATGAGDVSIAAYLTALMNGEGPADCAKLAAAEGCASVSSYDALGGVLPLEELKKRIALYEGGTRACL